MTTDPFANLDTNAEAETTNTPTTKKETTVSNPTETQSKIVTTLKGGSGYDAPWVVIHSDTPEEALEVLKAEELKELIDQAKKVGTYFAGGSAKKSGGAVSNGAPAGATQAPNGAQPPEGYVYKTGITKSGKNAGKPWYAFMDANRSGNLEPIWLNADGSRRN